MSYMGRTDGRDGNGFGRAVNFNYILRTGQIPAALKDDPTKTGDDMEYVDFASDDPYTRALNSVETSSIKRIQADPELSALLGKKPWSKDDRMVWESKVSKILSQELDKIPGLDKYRVESPDGPKRVTRLNDISADMVNGTQNVEFDCESMSAFEGMVLQRVDNKLLPPTAEGSDFKRAGQYYFIQGRADVNPNALKTTAGHAFIFSSVTGSIIDATMQGNESPYFTPKDKNFSFDDFTTGNVSLYSNGSANVIYSTYGNYDVAAYKLRNSMIPGMEQYRTPADLLFDTVGTSAEFRSNKLWSENLHLSELKENILAQRKLLRMDTPGSDAYNERLETVADLEQDFKKTVLDTAFRSSDSVEISNDAFVKYNNEISGVSKPLPSATAPTSQSGAAPQLGGVNKQISPPAAVTAP